MRDHPEGTVTFLFTDIEGSTRLAQSHASSWERLRARHDALMQDAIDAHRGFSFKRVGDAFCVAFATAAEAAAAAVAAQRALQAEPWAPAPLRVRMGLHTGPAEIATDGAAGTDYVGYATLARTQRVMSAAHGEQVIVSSTTAHLLREGSSDVGELRDLGDHRLKDFPEPEHLWQLVAHGVRSEFPALATSATTPSNLPVWSTRFVGRAAELTECRALLQSTRLFTLTAIGGAGKTRLAVETARMSLDDYPDGVWFVDLAQVQDAARVVQATAAVLGLKDQPGVDPLDAVVTHLASRRMLIVLDNCEHVLEASADLARALLDRCERVTILATSREGLGIPGEQIFTVRSLAMPSGLDPDSVRRSDAVALFVDRARLANPSLAFDGDAMASIVDICRRLDGIALAIELAAARVKMLTLHDLRARLGDRFRLLTGGNRALPRQQTLLATLQWSYDLLAPPEQRMLRLLGVFTGGWTIRAATAVAGDGIDEFEVLDTIGRLADKSLVALDRNVQGETRYTMVETVRQYALDRSDPDEVQQARRRHARFFVALATDLGAGSSRGPIEAMAQRIDADLENVLAAHGTCGQHPDLVEPGLELVGGLASYWQHRGMLNLAWQITGEALARDGLVADDVRWRALDTKALVALLVGAYDEGLDACEEALAMARRRDDREGIAALLARKLSILNARGQVDEARAVDDECMRLGQALGGRYLYNARHHRAELLRRAGDFASAQRLYEHNLAEAEAANRSGSLVTGHGNLALVTLQQGDTALARAHLIALLDVKDADRNFISDILALQACAALAALKGAFHFCARLHAVANAMSDRMHYRAEPVDAMAYAPPIERARDALGAAPFAAILAEGAEEKPDEVRKEARAWLRSLTP